MRHLPVASKKSSKLALWIIRSFGKYERSRNKIVSGLGSNLRRQKIGSAFAVHDEEISVHQVSPERDDW